MANTIKTKYMYGGSVDALYCHPNYPIFSGGQGSLIGVFDACLVNGFGEVTLSSLTIDANGIATATSNGHGYNKVPLVILISGAEQEAINGEWEITGYTNDTILFDATDSGLTNTTITGGAIKLKVAPLGWEKVYSDVPNNVAVYRSKDPFSRQHFLRVDDSDAYGVQSVPAAFCRGYEQMSSAQDIGIGPYPSSATLARGVSINKSFYGGTGIYATANSANLSWTLVGTSRQFYFNPTYYIGSVSGGRMIFFFGDLVSYIPGDYGASMIAGGTAVANTYAPTSWNSTNDYTGRYCSRSLIRQLLPSSLSHRNKILIPSGTIAGLMGGVSQPPFLEPDTYCNKMILARPIFIVDEEYPNNLRGEQPGFALPLNRIVTLSPKYEINTVFTVNGERFMYLGHAVHSDTYGSFFLSLDRDWNTRFYD